MLCVKLRKDNLFSFVRNFSFLGIQRTVFFFCFDFFNFFFSHSKYNVTIMKKKCVFLYINIIFDVQIFFNTCRFAAQCIFFFFFLFFFLNRGIKKFFSFLYVPFFFLKFFYFFFFKIILFFF